MFLLLLEFFPHVILITWGLESGLAKFFFAESVPLWYCSPREDERSHQLSQCLKVIAVYGSLGSEPCHASNYKTSAVIDVFVRNNYIIKEFD